MKIARGFMLFFSLLAFPAFTSAVLVQSTSMTEEELQNLIDAAPADTRSTIDLSHVEEPIEVTRGIVIDRAVRLIAPRLRPAEDVTAMRFVKGSKLTIVEAAEIEGPKQGSFRPDPTTAKGFVIESAIITIRDAVLTKLAVGVQAISSGTTGINANIGRVEGLRCVYVGTCIDLQGPDSNAGKFESILISNSRLPISDRSFLGNTFIHTFIEGTEEDGVSIEQTQYAGYSLFLGSYIEGNKHLCKILGHQSLVVGSNMPTRLTDDSRCESVGSSHAFLRFRRNKNDLRVHIPGRGAGDRVMQWFHPDDNKTQTITRHVGGRQRPKYGISVDGFKQKSPIRWAIDDGQYELGDPIE